MPDCNSLDRKTLEPSTKRENDHIFLCVLSDLIVLDDKGRLQQSRSKDIGVFDQGRRWPYLSLCSNGLDCLWMTKGDCNSLGRKTLESSTEGADDHIILRMPSDLIVSGWQRETTVVSVKKHWSLRQKGQMTIFVSACHQTWLPLDDEGRLQ